MNDYTPRKSYESFAKNCLRGEKPQCVCACPLNLDIPAFTAHIQEGNFTLAYKLYQNQVVFPGIVSRLCTQPCAQACVRSELDEGVSMLSLEEACIRFSATTEPPRFNLPPRQQRVAVIGAGLCGLTCALKLASKSYEVTVFEQSGRIGGRLWDIFADDYFLKDIELQFKNVKWELMLNTKITSLDSLGYDAVFIATGKNGDGFGLAEGFDRKSFGTASPGVFIGGDILGTSPVEDIAQGITAAYSIEKYIKTSLMDGIAKMFFTAKSPLKTDLSRVSCKCAVIPGPEGYTKEKAILESERCLKCDCTVCADGCELFGYFSRQPTAMVSDAVASLHTKNSFMGQHATRMMASCNLCGLCGEICPKGIDMGKFFDDFRHFKAEDKMFPPAFHDFFLRDMHFSNNEAYLAKAPPGYDTAEYLYFPGCQLGASDPKYIEKSYEYLLERIPGTALMLGCCGAPADWGADKALHSAVIDKLRGEWERLGEPVIIFACPTCKHQFERFMPEIRGVSLYETILEKGLPGSAVKDMEACVFDPCASRYDPSMQKSVREIVLKSDIMLKELYYSQGKAQCCGWGGHISQANPQLAETIVRNRTGADTRPYITYCTNCRDTFAQRGKRCFHILDIIFDLDKERYVPPSLSQRRRNRLIAKKNVLEKVWNIDMDDTGEYKSSIKIKIPDDLTAKMNDLLILEEDVYKTVEYCEKSGNKIFDTEKECFAGHLRIGIITYWVEYVKEAESCVLKNVYSHRVEIVES